MNRLNIAVLLVSLQLAPLFSQGISNPQVIYVLVDPSGPCGYGYITVNRTTGNTKGCVSGTWTNISGAIGPTGPTGPTGASGFPVPTAQAVTSGVTTSVVIPLNGTLTDKSQALPSCWTNASPSEYTLAYSGATMNAGLTQMTISFSGTTTAGFTGTCTAVPSIGPVGPTGPTGAAGAGISGLTTGTIPKAASATTLNDSPITVSGSNISVVGTVTTPLVTTTDVLNTANRWRLDGSTLGLTLSSTSWIRFAQSSVYFDTADVGISRVAAGIIGIGSGANTSTAGHARGASFQSGGATFTATGCSNGTLVGGATAGTLVSGTTGTCTVVITMGSSATSPTGWACSASDRTTPANLISQTASSTTTCTISGTTVSGDVLSFSAIGY